jgi:phage gp29-like protein
LPKQPFPKKKPTKGQKQPKVKSVASATPKDSELPENAGVELSYVTSALYRTPPTPYNPDDLVGQKGLRVYRKMLNDEQIKAAVSAKHFAVLSTGYEIVAPDADDGEEDETGKEMADFVKFNFDEMGGSFDSKLLEIMTATVFGFSVSEKIWGYIDYGKYEGKTGLIALKTRQPFEFDFDADEHGNLKADGIVQSRFLRMPPEKFVVYSYRKTFDNLYGESDLRAAYRYYWLKDNILRFMAITLERYGEPTWIFSHTQRLTNNQRSELEEFIQNMASKKGLIVQKDIEASTESPDPKTGTVYIPAVDLCDTGIRISLLMPGLIGLSGGGGTQGTGSFARAIKEFDLFIWIIEQLRNDLETIIDEQIVKPLVDLNYEVNEGKYPQFRFKEITQDHKENIFKLWTQAVQAQALTKTRDDENRARELIEFPHLPDNVPVTGEPLPPGTQFPDGRVAGPDGQPSLPPQPPGADPGNPGGNPLPFSRQYGGPGSGNIGHAGRPGEVGGSLPSGAAGIPASNGGEDYVRPTPEHVKTVEEAVTKILAGKTVEVDDVQKVHTIVERLAYMAEEAKSKGAAAPNYDLCQVSVKGTNLFCADNLGIPRIKMPQFAGEPVPGSEADKLPRTKWEPKNVDAQPQFLEHLKSLGIRTSEGRIPASWLRASQRELVGPKVAAMALDTKTNLEQFPIVISRDGYIVDGHHRWAALVERDAADGKLGDTMIKYIKVDAPISEVLHISNDWTQKFGIAVKGVHARHFGGEGSGNWGHAGRPNEVGGSLPTGEGSGLDPSKPHPDYQPKAPPPDEQVSAKEENLTPEEHAARQVHIDKLNQATQTWLKQNAPGGDIGRGKLMELSKYLGTQYKDEVDAITRDFNDSSKYSVRPVVHLGGGPGTPDIYILGWRERTALDMNSGIPAAMIEGTQIHDHGPSEAGIYIHKGNIDEHIYAFAPSEFGGNELHYHTVDRSLGQGSSVAIQSPYIHDFFAPPTDSGLSVSIHSYYPPLKDMSYYKPAAKGLLTKVGHWKEGDPIEGSNTKALSQDDWGWVRGRIGWYHLPGLHNQLDHGRRGPGLADTLLNRGGFTYNPVKVHDKEAPPDGFALSVRPDAEEIMHTDGLTKKYLRMKLGDYVARFKDELKQPDAYLGAWHDKDSGRIFLDLSKVVKDKNEAMSLAKQAHQLGIYDLAHGETIKLAA